MKKTTIILLSIACLVIAGITTATAVECTVKEVKGKTVILKCDKNAHKIKNYGKVNVRKLFEGC